MQYSTKSSLFWAISLLPQFCIYLFAVEDTHSRKVQKRFQKGQKQDKKGQKRPEKYERSCVTQNQVHFGQEISTTVLCMQLYAAQGHTQQMVDARIILLGYREYSKRRKEGLFVTCTFNCVAAQWGRLLVKEFGTSSMVQQCSAPKNYMGSSINYSQIC